MSLAPPIARRSPLAARLTLAALFSLALTGGFLTLGRGRLPQRETTSEMAQQPAAPTELAPDLALYCELIAEVRAGGDYYAAARERIPAYGFPISSPLNWRLPTYAWLLSRFPCPAWIQLGLIVLSIAALGLVFAGEARSSGLGAAAVVTFLQFGVVRWAVDGYAFLAQEPWAATLLLVSLGAYRLADPQLKRGFSTKQSAGWLTLAIAAGIAALFMRELALPYCGIACCLALYRRRWVEAAAWTLGIAAFFGFFAWHVLQVQAQLVGTDSAAAAGLSQWLRLGGLDFVLLTTRMNALLFAAPSWLLWLYLLAALVGLARRQDDASRLACLGALAYLLAFAFLGRPENFYWGLMAAPLLPLGIVAAPQAFSDLWNAARVPETTAVTPVAAAHRV